jgi:hypothetical protein
MTFSLVSEVMTKRRAFPGFGDHGTQRWPGSSVTPSITVSRSKTRSQLSSMRARNAESGSGFVR